MCILFLHTNLKPLRGGFRLILAANRDEAYKRPTLPAHFWMENPNVIGGRDMEPGREGGTWLAMSKSGRIAALLNVLHLQADGEQVAGRGNLVSDFVLESAATAKQYTADLAASGSKYNKFNLVAIEIGQDSIRASACSNANAEPISLDLGTGTIGLGNSLIGRPFSKVTAGIARFEKIVGEYGTCETKDTLRDRLIDLLRWDEKHFPDSEMQQRGSHLPGDRLEKLSSVFVQLLPVYGTRTHTLVLVDDANNVDFIEWTMLEPIDPEQPTWTKLEKTFKLAL